MATDLQKAFKEVSELFNDGKYDALAKVCDPDIIMKRVDDPGSIAGIGNFVAYLNTHQAHEKPRFLDAQPEEPIVRDPEETNGQISGIGNYLDKANTKPIPVRFTFTFTRNNSKSDWLLINAFAAPLKK